MAPTPGKDLHDTHSAGHVSKRKVSRSLVAMSSAAVMAVYTAGYLRTKAAAEQFDEAPARRRPSPVVAESATAALPPVTALPSQPERAGVAESPAASSSEAVAAPPRAVSPEGPTPPLTPDLASPQTTTAPVALVPEPAPAAAAAAAAAPEPAQPGVAAPQAAPDVAAAPAKEVWKDGSYLGWGYSRHGNIQAQVVIADGRIASASIFNCMTRYPCSWIEKLPAQVAERQSADVDYVSGATESADAFYQAVYRALLQAK